MRSWSQPSAGRWLRLPTRRRVPWPKPNERSSPRSSTTPTSACAACGERDHLAGFSGAAGGMVCTACEAGAFALEEPAHAFLVGALGRPLAEAPDAAPRALAQAERAILETLEHHAHIRLRAVSTLT